MLKEWLIPDKDVGQKVDKYLQKLLPHLSTSRLHSLFRRDEVKVGKKPVNHNYILKTDDILKIYGLHEDELTAGHKKKVVTDSTKPEKPIKFDIPIVFEDEELLVLNKPGNLAVHPGTGIILGNSLIEKAQVYLAPSQDPRALFQPALVHRLDKETSGLILIAKNSTSLRELHHALREKNFRKQYVTLVEGIPDPLEGTLNGPLLRIDAKEGGAKSVVGDPEGKDAVTHYKVKKKMGLFALLDVIIETGRMHQIRAHLADAGHPVLGDSRYGNFNNNRQYKKDLGLRRTFLHAARLDFSWKNRACHFTAPLPADLQECLNSIDNLETSRNNSPDQT